MATPRTFNVGVIIGSQRVLRVGPQIAHFVLNTIKAADEKTHAKTQDSSTSPPRPAITFDMIDIKAQNLPFFDEPGIPAQIKSADGYVHEHTRVWSRRIAALDAFVFIAPQRNWSFPAELKNAIDYLFNEWKDKPAMIVSYGGHGGNQSAGHLKTVLGSMGVRVADTMPGLAFPNAEFRVKCFKGEELGLDGSNGAGFWSEKAPEIVTAWEELINLLDT